MADPTQKLPLSLERVYEALMRVLPGGAIDKSLSEKVSKSGDTMTGNLRLAGRDTWIDLPDYGGGGWTHGHRLAGIDGTRIGEFGFSGAGGSLAQLFVGWGATPHQPENCLSISSTALKYKDKVVFHAGNKPSGTYTGNGDATNRSINTGGLGSVLCMYANGNVILVGFYGAIYWYGWDATSTVKTISGNEILFRNGVLTLASTRSDINGNGTVFYYQVL